MLFPVSFLFGHFVSTPLLIKGLGLPFPIALLVSNISGILLLNQLVPLGEQALCLVASELGLSSRCRSG